MLILEGADLVGKTTLANKILNSDKWRRFCFDESPNLNAVTAYRHLSKATEEHDHLWYYQMMIARGPCIQDRFHMSELIYRCAAHEPLHLSPEKYNIVDAWLRLAGSLTVVLTATETLIESRWVDTEMYPVDTVQRANNLYMMAAGNLDYFAMGQRYALDIGVHRHLDGDIPDAMVDDILDRYITVKMFNSENHISHPPGVPNV